MTIGHFTVVCLGPEPLSGREAEGDLVLIQTLLLLICKSFSSYANYMYFLVSIMSKPQQTSLSYRGLVTCQRTVRWPIVNVVNFSGNGAPAETPSELSGTSLDTSFCDLNLNGVNHKLKTRRVYFSYQPNPAFTIRVKMTCCSHSRGVQPRISG